MYDTWSKIERTLAKDTLEKYSDEVFVAHNAQFDLDFLAEHLDYHHKGTYFDTMVAYQMIMNGKLRYGDGETAKLDDVIVKMANVVPQLKGVTLDKTYQKPEWYEDPHFGGEEEQVLQYAAEDTAVLELIHPVLEKKLKQANLYHIFRLEMMVLPILVEATRKGVYFREKAAADLAKKLESEVYWLEEYVLKPMVPEEWVDDFNPRSPKTISQYFKLPDAQEDTLREFVKKTKDPLAEGVMEMKKRQKKQSSIEKQLIQRVAYDGRIHPRFNQTGTETGRFSSSGPNLQNQDRGADVRGLFVPSEGMRFVIADYSQLELRLAAFFSRDEVMLEAYQNGRDLHTETQTRIFGDPTAMDPETKKKTRTLSKNINFGLVFGGGHNTLIKFAAKSGVEIDEDTAIEYKEAFRETYPGLYRWQRKQGDTRPATVTTVKGRRRFIESGKAYCTRINHPVQGSAADGMKSALLRVYRSGILPLLNVHDELVCEVPADTAEQDAQTVIDCMVQGMYSATEMDPDDPVVPIVVEGGAADSWAEK